jgi:hypothetical protein
MQFKVGDVVTAPFFDGQRLEGVIKEPSYRDDFDWIIEFSGSDKRRYALPYREEQLAEVK